MAEQLGSQEKADAESHWQKARTQKQTATSTKANRQAELEEDDTLLGVE